MSDHHHTHEHKPLPALRGALLALGAAALFGISTPLVQRAGVGMGAFSTASLLYVGAAIIGALMQRSVKQEARVQRSDGPRLLAMAIFGAGIGPVALAWGLQHTSGTAASLMLALEAVFTAVLARSFYGETMGSRVWAAMLLLTLGGMALVLDRGLNGGLQLWGLLAVAGATVSWGIDNTLSRNLAERDPGQVVMSKSVMGALATAMLAAWAKEPAPGLPAALGLLTIGACGYGLSLKLYLLAQRAFGAGRTGSVFAFAPFIGAMVAVGLGDQSYSWGVAIGGMFMLAGVALHLTESHGHEHVHEAQQHEHAHRHDDGHHNHVHAPMPTGIHSHPHQHAPLTHTHPHVPDAHHTHAH